MTRTVVCFGDSNTHGADPTGAGRMAREFRWPRVMARELDDGYEVIEEGLNGRTACWETPLEPGRNGLTYLVPCLLSHAPVDLVIIMLGTNDLKRIYGNTASEIACGAARLIDEAPRPGAHGTRIAFVHPKGVSGVLTELCEQTRKH